MERTEPEFDIRVSFLRDDARAIAVVCGDVDVATSTVLRRRVLSLMREGFSVTMDLNQVTFMDVSGLSVMVDLLRTSRRCGTDFSVANPSRAVLRLAEITRRVNPVLWPHLHPPQSPDGGD